MTGIILRGSGGRCRFSGSEPWTGGAAGRRISIWRSGRWFSVVALFLLSLAATPGAVALAPAIDGGAVATVTMSEDGQPTPFVLALRAEDPEADPLSWSISTNALHGTAAVIGSGTNATVSYQAATNYFGADSFVVRAADPGLLFDEVLVQVTIDPVNDAPRLQANLGLVTYELTEVAITTNLLRAADVDHNDGQIRFVEFSGGTGTATHVGTLRRSGQVMTNGDSFTMSELAAGAITYAAPITPFNLAFDSFVFRVRDDASAYASDGGFSTFTFPIRIEESNYPPQTVNGSIQASLGGSSTGQFHAVDVNQPADTLTFSIVSNGLRGTAVLTDPATGAFTYTPTSLVAGVDTVAFQVSDGLVGAATNGVMTVTLYDAPPVAFVGNYTSERGQPVSGQLVASDPLGQDLSFVVVTPPGRGTVTVEQATGTFVYDPAPGRFGSDEFFFAAVDTLAQTSAPARIGLTITRRPLPGDLLFTLQIDQGPNPPIGAVGIVGSVAGDLVPLTMGGSLGDPRGIVYSPEEDAVYVADGAGPRPLVRIDADSGTQSVVSAGGLLTFPVGVAIGADGALYVANGAPAGIIRVDPVSGTQSVFAAGGYMLFPVGLKAVAGGGFRVTDIVNFGAPPGGMVIDVDASGAVQTLITSNQNLVLPVDVCVLSNGVAAVADIATGVVRLTLSNGAQQAMTALPGQAFGITRADDGWIYVTCRLDSPQRCEIHRVNPLTGAATVFAGASGTIMGGPFGITHIPLTTQLRAAGEAAGAAIMWDSVSGAVYRVDSSLSLLPADWQPTGVLTGNGGALRLSITNQAGATFFRCEATPK